MAVSLFPMTTTRLAVDSLPCPTPLRNAPRAASNGVGLWIAPTSRDGLSSSTRARCDSKKQHEKKQKRRSFSVEVFALAAGSGNSPTDDSVEVSSFGTIAIPNRSIGRSGLEKWSSGASDGSVEAEVASGGGDEIGGAGRSGDGDGNGAGGGDGSMGDGESDEAGSEENRNASLAVLAAVARSIESLPEYLKAAVEKGKIPPAVLERFLELEKTSFRKWLMGFGGFRERLLADDLFLTKVGIECGVGVFTKTAAEYERRRENFVKELDFVIADVIMALLADFMLVWLPAPTVSLAPALANNANAFSKFLANCPDNAFQIALRGTSYSTLQRVAAVVRNGSKLLVVGTSASLMGTAATNALIMLRPKDKNAIEEKSEEVDVPILETSLAYGVYMAVSSNLRYQLLAGVVEQRVLEPLLHRQKVALAAASFAVRTGNTFLGSLLWVDYARWVGVQ